MKSIKNYLLAVLALAAILTVVSCKNEDEDPSEVASYTASVDGVKVTATFYENGTFRMAGDDGAVLEGKYTGDADKDGELTLELTKASADGEVMPEEYLASLSVMIGGNGTTKTGKGTISNDGKKLSFGSYGGTYTRK